MIDNQRRNRVIGALLAPLAASITLKASAAEKPVHDHKMPDIAKVPWMGEEQIAMLVYPGMTIMDLVGPHCMFGSLMGAKIHIVAKSLVPVTSDAGLTVIPTATFDTCPRDLTVLFTPGGTYGTAGSGFGCRDTCLHG